MWWGEGEKFCRGGRGEAPVLGRPAAGEIQRRSKASSGGPIRRGAGRPGSRGEHAEEFPDSVVGGVEAARGVGAGAILASAVGLLRRRRRRLWLGFSERPGGERQARGPPETGGKRRRLPAEHEVSRWLWGPSGKPRRLAPRLAPGAGGGAWKRPTPGAGEAQRRVPRSHSGCAGGKKAERGMVSRQAGESLGGGGVKKVGVAFALHTQRGPPRSWRRWGVAWLGAWLSLSFCLRGGGAWRGFQGEASPPLRFPAITRRGGGRKHPPTTTHSPANPPPLISSKRAGEWGGERESRKGGVGGFGVLVSFSEPAETDTPSPPSARARSRAGERGPRTGRENPSLGSSDPPTLSGKSRTRLAAVSPPGAPWVFHQLAGSSSRPLAPPPEAATPPPPVIFMCVPVHICVYTSVCVCVYKHIDRNISV